MSIIVLILVLNSTLNFETWSETEQLNLRAGDSHMAEDLLSNLTVPKLSLPGTVTGGCVWRILNAQLFELWKARNESLNTFSL
jgi:hypothetical protein